jgi:hypothetical protein
MAGTVAEAGATQEAAVILNAAGASTGADDHAIAIALAGYPHACDRLSQRDLNG